MKKFILTEEDRKHIKGLYEQNEQPSNTVVNKVGTEGLKNITPEMVSDPPFKGEYSGYIISGVFKNVEYQWDCHGVQNFSGVRGMVNGTIGTERVESICEGVKITCPEDAKPNSLALQFDSSNTHMLIYTTNSGKAVCLTY